jgi:hypothetical protein
VEIGTPMLKFLEVIWWLMLNFTPHPQLMAVKDLLLQMAAVQLPALF